MEDPTPNESQTSPNSEASPNFDNGDERCQLPVANFAGQEHADAVYDPTAQGPCTSLPNPNPNPPAHSPATDRQDLTQPTFVNGQFYSLDPRNITVNFIVQMTSAVSLSIGGVVGLVFLWASLGFSWLFLSILAVALLIMGCLFLAAYLWPPLDYRNTKVRIDPLGIEIRQGVLWRHQICVPIGRVQHADVSQGPIQRINGVASLTLHTAGTSNASVAIDGLTHQFAIEIRDWIVHQRKNEDAV